MTAQLPKSVGPPPLHRAESGTEVGVDEITEGQVLQQERARSAPPLPAPSRLGQLLAGRYRLERVIAKGGMGRVYLATQMPLERQVAIKLLIAKGFDEEFRKRFFLEASTCARLVHRHIVTVHDYGEAENGELFMAMEYLDGEPLSKVISREIRLDSDRACQIALQICRALRTAHKSGIVHRDLKPGNVMLLRDDEQESADFVKVLDFGLVKTFGDNEPALEPSADLTRSGTWLGSPRYMSPEQIRCQTVDPRTDIYSLGIIIFHMVAGRPPFVGANSVEILEQHLRDPVPNIRDLVGEIHYAPELEEIISKCLAKDPAERYQSMDAVIADLKAVYRISTGVSIHTESSLPTFHELGAEADSDSGAANIPPRPRAETLSTRPPPAPALGPAPDLGPISEPSATPLPVPQPDLPVEGPPKPAVSPPRPSPAPRAEPAPRAPAAVSRSKAPWLALMLVFVVLAGFFVTRWLMHAGSAGPGVVLSIRSQPEGAQVLSADGQLLGVTPYVVSLPAALRGRSGHYTLRHPGYEERQVETFFNQDTVLAQVKLQPLVPEVEAEPPPEPAALPEPKPVERAAQPNRVEPRPTTARSARTRRPARAKQTRRESQATKPAPAPSSATKPPQAPAEVPTVVEPPPARAKTVDAPRRGLLVDEGADTLVRDTQVPVVD